MSTTNLLVFYINGRRLEVVNPSQETTLLQFLRDNQRLTATKLSCGEGSCGACTVTVARQGHGGLTYGGINACITKLCSLHGTAVFTAEGLVKDGELHPIQERIHLGHGVQCGFCTPGFVMSMHGRLQDPNAPPVIDVEDVVSCLSGNICRCTGYRPIVEAFGSFCSNQNRSQGSQQTFDVKNFKPYDSAICDPKIPTEISAKGGIHDQYLKFEDVESGHRWYRPTTLKQLEELQENQEPFRRFMGGTGNYKRDPSTFAKFTVTVQLDGIADLRMFSNTSDAFEFGSGLTLSEWSNILTSLVSNSILNGSSKSLLSAYVKALQLGSPQLRNVARVGGSVFYTHPCSDLLPLHAVCGALMEVIDKGQKKIIPIDEVFCSKIAEEIQNGTGIVTKLIIPKPKDSDNLVAGFFKKSRRKAFDLAVLNVGLFAKLNNRIIEEIKISVGGEEDSYVLAKANVGPLKAQNLESLLQGTDLNSFNVENEALVDAIRKDINVHDHGAGDFGFLRRSALLSFIKEFLSELNSNKKEEKKCKKDFYQLFKKVDENQNENDLVERPIPHMWSQEMAKGSSIFTNDIRPTSDELVAVMVRSNIPHGKILSIDFNEALAVPGVFGVVSSKDLSEEQNLWGISGVYDEEVFASETVHYYGQPIAALYCKDEKSGRHAATKVKIQYSESKAVFSIREERKKGNNLDGLDFFGNKLCLKRIQNEKEISNTDEKSRVTGTVSLGRQEHAYMEPHSALVIPTGEKDEYISYFTTQEPGTVQKNLSRVLQVPYHKIIVKTKRTGGAFGGKERLQTVLIAAACAKKSKRPVRCVLTRSEDMGITGHRHEVLVDYDVSFDLKSGRITHSKFKCYANAGHSIDLSLSWVNILMLRLDGGYTLTNFDAEGKALKTNVPSNTAFRGFGGPEGAIIIEEIIAKIAHSSGLAPNVIKEVNLTRNGDKLHHSSNLVSGSTLEKCWKECLQQSNYNVKVLEIDEFNSKSQQIKRGISITPLKFAPSYFVGFLFQACAQVKIYLDGTVLISHGGIEMGQGLNTKLIQVASRELLIDANKIHVGETSTEVVANAVPTGGSTGSDLYGHAVIDACQTLMARLKPYRDENPGGSWEDWVTAANMGKVNLNATGFFNASKVDYNSATNEGISHDYLTYGAGCVEVEVDCHTGDIQVLSAYLVMDVGKSLNPAIDIGQIEGAFLQGLGYVTTEQLVLDSSTGKLLTDNFSTYKVPTVHDMPDKIHVTLLPPDSDEEIVASTVFSSKGIGEPPIMLCAGITSAVREALTSYRCNKGLTDWFDMHFPLTVDKVCKIAQGGSIGSDEKKWALEV